MSDLVTLNKNSECRYGCGRKNCANPGWPSWMSYTCLEAALVLVRQERDAANALAAERYHYQVGYEREKARADLLAIEVAATGSQMLDLQRDCILKGQEIMELRSALRDREFTPEPR